jgi:hypothetical protein
MKRAIGTILLLIMWVSLVPGVAHARRDNAMEEVLIDGFYGGLAGALVGAAFMAFKENPGDHLDDIAIGAGVGVIAGTLYGVGRAARAFAEVEDGKLTVQMPTLRFDLEPAGKRLQPRWSADLLRVDF